MQTYYQKHRTIKAFPFNGTWYQLNEEVPKLVQIAYKLRNKPYSTPKCKDGYVVYIDIDDEDRFIDVMWICLDWWPLKDVKIKHRKHYWRKYYNCHNAKAVKRMNMRNYKYEYVFKLLRYGDYVTTYYRTYYDKESGEYWIQRRIKIIPREDFESHWSPVPIKPKKYRHS